MEYKVHPCHILHTFAHRIILTLNVDDAKITLSLGTHFLTHYLTVNVDDAKIIFSWAHFFTQNTLLQM